MNNQLIGLKKIICSRQNCSFFVSCLEATAFNITYKLTYTKFPSQVFSSSLIECQNPTDDFITFNEIANKVLNI